jgi:hypothetical protein
MTLFQTHFWIRKYWGKETQYAYNTFRQRWHRKFLTCWVTPLGYNLATSAHPFVKMAKVQIE